MRDPRWSKYSVNRHHEYFYLLHSKFQAHSSQRMHGYASTCSQHRLLHLVLGGQILERKYCLYLTCARSPKNVLQYYPYRWKGNGTADPKYNHSAHKKLLYKSGTTCLRSAHSAVWQSKGSTWLWRETAHTAEGSQRWNLSRTNNVTLHFMLNYECIH